MKESPAKTLPASTKSGVAFRCGQVVEFVLDARYGDDEAVQEALKAGVEVRRFGRG